MGTSRVTRTLGSIALLSVVGFAGFQISGCSHSGGGGGIGPAASTAPGSTTRTNAPTPTPVTTAPTTVAVTSAANPLGPVPTYGTQKCWPIVLVHGLAGFKQLGFLEYWYQIPETLTANGFEVFVVQDKPFASIAERASEMQAQVMAKYPDPRVKVNLIGHSMGGLDCRYAVSQLGMASKVASVTTIGSPHRGSSVADVIFGLVPGPVQAMIQFVFNLVGLDITSANELTTYYMANTFNPGTPDAPGVQYFSWEGSADPLGTTGCIVDPLFDLTWSIVNNIEGENDGLVSNASAKWGNFQGKLPADHINEVGQPLGVTAPSFDHLKFYETWADKLVSMGFGP
jgi:triacylglycerol lipase